MTTRLILIAALVAARSSAATLAAGSDAATPDHTVVAVFKAAVPNFTRVVASTPAERSADASGSAC